MKLKYTGIIKIEPVLTSKQMFRVTKGTELVPAGQVMRLEYIKANFRPVCSESLNLMDPDRNKRLCQPIIGE